MTQSEQAKQEPAWQGEPEDALDNLPEPPADAGAPEEDGVSIFELGFDLNRLRQRVAAEYRIEDKRSGAFNVWGPLLKRNPPQLKLLQLILREAKRGGPVRILVLKGRKVGVSTAVELLLLDLVMQLENWTAGVVAHTDDSATKLFGMARHAYEQLDAAKRPELRRDQQNMMEFGKRHKKDRDAGARGHVAKFKTATAAGSYPFSGDTVRALHLSECAKYDAVGDDEAQMRFILSAIQAVPKNAASFVVAETTANGQQGWFYETWTKAEANKLAADGLQWIPFFISWLADPSTRMRVHASYTWDDWPEEDKVREEELRARYSKDGVCTECGGAFNEHLRFRRFVIKEEMSSDPDLFNQEFPTTPTEAFLSSGRPGMPKRALDLQEQHISEPARRLSSRFSDAAEGGMTYGFDGDDSAPEPV